MVLHNSDDANNHSRADSTADIENAPSSIIMNALKALRKYQQKPTLHNKKLYEQARNEVLDAEQPKTNQ